MLSAKASLQDIRTIISLNLYFGKFKTKHCVTNSISQGRSPAAAWLSLGTAATDRRRFIGFSDAAGLPLLCFHHLYTR